MKKILFGIVFGGVVLAGWTGWGQTHKVTKPESVVRAVGVYEWTGDLAKPKASRLIPVTLFIEGKLEDAGVYIARPVPFALLTGNIYELQDGGVAKGTLELSYARHLQTVDAAYDDGWFGYGVFHAPEAAKKAAPLRASKTLPVIKSSSSDSGKPHFSNKSGDATTPGGTDADKTKDSSGANTPADDPDRPTLKRRSPEEEKKAQRAKDDVATVTGTGSLNDDPNRPNLHRGKPAAAMTETDLPKLSGLPPDLHQMLAVSDAATRNPHEFVRPWEDAAEKAAVLAKMQAMARAQLATYGGSTAAPPAIAAPSAAKKAPANRTRRAATPAPAPPVA